MAARGLVSVRRFMRPLGGSVIGIRPVTAASESKNQQQLTSASPSVVDLLKKKTGDTGHYVLKIGVVATLFSKELIVFNEEVLVGGSLLTVIYFLYKKFGPVATEFFDKRTQAVLDVLNAAKQAEINYVTKRIAQAENVEKSLSCRHEAYEVLREEAELGREEEYRKRLVAVRNEVKRRLDYHAQIESLEKDYQRKHLLAWLKDNVHKELVSKQDDGITQCVSLLKKMATTS